VDWWIHLGISIHLPADVDQQGRIWWIWTINCSQKMLLSIVNCNNLMKTTRLKQQKIV